MPDGEEQEVISSLIEGGIFGVVVETGAKADGGLVGGAQASISPHGLGAGWGVVGAAEKRLRVTDLLNDDPSVPHLTAALKGMSSGASFGIASLDDHAETGELLQERLLAALRKAKVSTPLLVWRSVLATLFAIERGTVEEGQAVGVVSHTGDGVTVQRLRIRRERSHGETVLAPERRSTGKLIRSGWGYRGLAELAKSAISRVSSVDRTDHLEWARSNGRLALGFQAEPEVLRQGNGDWQVLRPPDTIDHEQIPRLQDVRDDVAGCDVVLLETLSKGAIRKAFHSAVIQSIGGDVVLLADNSIADGALHAARRLSKRDPIYFDFLPQISTIVQRRDAVENFDLVDYDETLPAGEMYRSPKPARLAIQAGQDRFSIFLRKETSELPRKAEVNIGVKVDQTVPVELWVEQSPASGRAKILVHSQKFGHQFQVDWDAATELEQNWDALIEGFQRPAPTIPGRLVLACGIDSWNDSPRGDGLFTLLEKNVDRTAVDWTALANRLSARPGGKYAISSDGDVPNGVDAVALSRLDRLVERALDEVRRGLRGQAVGTQSLRFLTWQFRRCPPDVSGWLLEAWDKEARGHPIFTQGAHWKLAYQGLGRVASNQHFELQAIHKVLGKPIDQWKWQKETAAMAFLLSRSETAPRLLTRKDVERLTKRILREFEENLGSTYTRFQYAPMLLVGLLRWRVVEPFALVEGQDPKADKLVRAVERTIGDLKHQDRLRALAKYGRILEHVLEELRGEGSNPELLLDIFGGADGSDADE
ncbi:MULTISPECIES: hypothetical protein [Rhizobium]|uniref:Uncharacterized protein n=3 Tax=Rhizobium TaxID=379 RepID=A0A7W8XVG9_9HYPH|nr:MULTISPECIES: hypothetical protein [Rhizobium]MBB5576316.1 hypothetical protein [Rhizobium paranaense]MBB4245073.1 hypothetical protein [Rhizobium tropici]MBB5596395.1 hypothetical protein [Rhizobium tropici]MBB6489223.1 hypothetical protein [Rhizobium lusitanum]MBB6495371.1 hypothetical protein [Rhizobium tropici]